MKDLLCLLGLLAQIVSSHGDDICYDMREWPSSYKTCTDGCCGTYPYEDCCDPPEDTHDDLDNAIIINIGVGSVIGGILLISFIVCIVCICIKVTGKSGRVIAPRRTVQSTAYTTSPEYPAQGYNNTVLYSYPQPPAYGQPTFAPPAYSITPSAPTISLTAVADQQGNRFPAHQALSNDPMIDLHQ